MPNTPAFPAVLRQPGAAAQSYLYVANASIPSVGGESIDIFLRKDPSKGRVGRIKAGVSGPDGIFVDSHGTLYVANAGVSGNGAVTVYPLGSDKPSLVYNGAACAFDVVAGSDGTVYVADACGGKDTRGRVIVYARGSTKPTHFLYPGGAPYAVTLDSKGDLYVGYNSEFSYYGQVKRYDRGLHQGKNLLPDQYVYFLTSIALDNRGRLLVTNGNGGVIDVFTTFGDLPSRVIQTGQSAPVWFAFDKTEKQLYVTDGCAPGGGLRVRRSSSSGSGCGKRDDTVVALDYASGKRLWTLHRRYWGPQGIAAVPSATR